MSSPTLVKRVSETSILPSVHVTENGCVLPVLEESDKILHANRILKYRSAFMEYTAEFFGTMILVIFGTGVNCQVILSSNPSVSTLPRGDWVSLSLGWATAVAMGVWVSGGHINPAITLAFATMRSFPWRKVPGYVVAQTLGATVGAAIIYANYIHAIDLVEGGPGIRTMKTAGLFGTVPLSYMTTASCFFAEFVASAILVFGIVAISDQKRNQLPPGLIPVGVWFLVLGIATCLGMQTGFALNPARDFGPRALTSMVGYGRQVYTMRNHYWAWCVLLATVLGAQLGIMLYDLFLYTGKGGSINKLLSWKGIYAHTSHPRLGRPQGGGAVGIDDNLV